MFRLCSSYASTFATESRDVSTLSRTRNFSHNFALDQLSKLKHKSSTSTWVVNHFFIANCNFQLTAGPSLFYNFFLAYRAWNMFKYLKATKEFLVIKINLTTLVYIHRCDVFVRQTFVLVQNS